MGRNDLLQYYAEGECEMNLLRTFMHAKKGDCLIRPGRIEKLNPVAEKISRVKAMTIRKGTRVALVFDTDIDNTAILEENVKTLKEVAGLGEKDIYFLMAVNRFEEELVFSCGSINSVKTLICQFGSQGTKSFKADFCNCRNLEEKMRSLGFDLKKMWTRSPNKPFDRFQNCGKSIKFNRKG